MGFASGQRGFEWRRQGKVVHESFVAVHWSGRDSEAQDQRLQSPLVAMGRW